VVSSPGADAPREPPVAKAWIACVLSALSMGLGQVYARRFARGLAWFAGTLVALVLLLALAVRFAPRVMLLVVVLAIALYAAGIVDAGLLARQSRVARASIALVVGLGVAFSVASRGTALLLRRFVVEAFRVPSGSMRPTLQPGDHMFVDKVRRPGRGDLAVFLYPEHRDSVFVKRILAVAGDEIRFDHGHPIVNGKPLASCKVGAAMDGEVDLEVEDGRTFLAYYDERSADLDGAEGPWRVPDGEVFAVGDNRRNAHDSRKWWGGQGGGVPMGDVLGVPVLIWLAIDEGGAADWSRANTPLEGPHLPRDLASLAPGLARCLAQL
jgi:signal peptidase I